MNQSLFGDDSKQQSSSAPLADRMRPESFDEILGQNSLVGKEAPFRRLVEQDKVPSCIFWGPPGSGKTTLAEVIAKTTQADFKRMSAVTAGVNEIRKIVQVADRKSVV